MNRITLVFLLWCLAGYVCSFGQTLHGLDATFAVNGIHMGDTGGAVKMAVQQDGKIIVVGGEVKNGILSSSMRFNHDGSLDNSFANNGYFRMQLPNGEASGFSSVCIQPDSKIVLGGGMAPTLGGNGNFCLVRLKTNGELDSSFGNNGNLVTSLVGDEYISSMALQPDGKIVVCGEWKGFDDNVLVARYHANGDLDSSFGTDGMVWSGWNDWGFTYPSVNDIAVLPDGRIVVGIDANIDSLNGANAFAAIRLLPDGRLDTSFNHTGVAYANDNMGWLIYCKAMCLQADGKVLLAGYDDSLVVLRFDTSGQLDNSFGNNGLVKLDPAGKIREILVQPDGKVVVGGYLDTCFALYRLLPNGSKDNSFGINGRVITKTANASNLLGDVTLQPDGKLIAGGMYFSGSSYGKLMIARYTPDATTSVHTPTSKEHLMLYPNPASDVIHLTGITAQTIRKLSVYTADGKALLTINNPSSNQINVEDFTNGIYYVIFSFHDYPPIVRKITIQKY